MGRIRKQHHLSRSLHHPIPSRTSYFCPLPGLSLMTPTTPTAAPVLITAIASSYPATLLASATTCKPDRVEPSLTSIKLKAFCERMVLTQPFIVTVCPRRLLPSPCRISLILIRAGVAPPALLSLYSHGKQMMIFESKWTKWSSAMYIVHTYMDMYRRWMPLPTITLSARDGLINKVQMQKEERV